MSSKDLPALSDDIPYITLFNLSFIYTISSYYKRIVSFSNTIIIYLLLMKGQIKNKV